MTPVDTVTALAARVREQIHKAIVGQEAMIDLLLVALLAGGHVLLEGVPGTAKTLTVRSLARLLDAPFARIQFTPDLMPSDIIGTSVFDPRTQEFHVKRGPLFAGLVLADEINRTPPKTQAALLEAMEERRVTIDGTPYGLPDPFLVCATQNPIEFEGTYPLPEAQLDRFMVKIRIDYPLLEEERSILERVQNGFRAQALESAGIEPVVSAGALAVYRAEIDRVIVHPAVQDYIVRIVRATREHGHITLGASPRAAVMMLLATKALAAVRGRAYVTPDDVKEITPAVLGHRILVRPESEIEGFTVERVLGSVLESVEVPR